MALPRQDATCEIPTDVCCTTLYDFSVELLDRVLADLNACSYSGDCYQELRGYVTVGGFPEDPLCDTLIVTATGIRPFVAPTGSLLPFGVTRCSFLVRLSESGFPMPYVEGEVIYAPDPDLVHEIARHAYSHGERMFRSIVNHLAGPSRIGSCAKATMDAFTPIDPSGGCVGWQASLSVDVTFGPLNEVGS